MSWEGALGLSRTSKLWAPDHRELRDHKGNPGPASAPALGRIRPTADFHGSKYAIFFQSNRWLSINRKMEAIFCDF